MAGAVRRVVYTDGACSGNPGPGGWAWLVPNGPFASGSAPASTNQRMEITAAWRAVEAIAGPLEVRSDSTYVVNCFRDRWWEGWIARNWHNSQRKPVANRDLWEPFIELVRARGDVLFTWVKGHGSDTWNDKADRLAVEAMRNQQGRTGTSTPEVFGPTDDPRPRHDPRSSAGGDLQEKAAVAPAGPVGTATYQGGVVGHAIVVVGHQPPELGGYEPNPLADAVRRRLGEILRAKASMFEDLVVVSGLRLGAEQLGAEAALAAGIPFVAVLPHPDPDARWPVARRASFARLCEQAAAVLVLQKQVPDTTARAAASMTRRDAWLVRHSDEAILVWDGEDQRLAKLQRSLEQRLGDDLWVLDPRELR